MSTSVMHLIDFAPATRHKEPPQTSALSCYILQPALLYIYKHKVLLCEGDPVRINKIRGCLSLLFLLTGSVKKIYMYLFMYIYFCSRLKKPTVKSTVHPFINDKYILESVLHKITTSNWLYDTNFTKSHDIFLVYFT